MEPLQVFVLFLTFACALGGLLLAFRVGRRVSKMFGKGDLKQALWQFFSDVPDSEGNTVPPQAAFFQFCNGLALNCTDHAIEQLPGALASLGGSSAAKKAAKHSAFARGAQNLSAGGFGELAGIKDMLGGFVGKIGTGGGKGDLLSTLAPMFIEKMMNQSAGDNGAPASLPPSQQSSQSLPSLGKPM
jgi:hypothetical protein